MAYIIIPVNSKPPELMRSINYFRSISTFSVFFNAPIIGLSIP